MQAGEKRLAERLRSLLDKETLCWYEMPVGLRRQRYSDFVIFDQQRGLLLLEVKDWKIGTIKEANPKTVLLKLRTGPRSVGNPLEQVRQCSYLLVKRLESDKNLVQRDGLHKNALLFPYGYGVVLTNITRRQFDTHSLGSAIRSTQVICQDEMTEKVSAKDFKIRLGGMFNVTFPFAISDEALNRVRWHLFPEIRINQDSLDVLFGADSRDEDDQETPDIVKVLDKQQEILARSLGSGHRVIHGVAGSGKTLILSYRAMFLAEILKKPVLVLCFNITLAAKLKKLTESRELENKIHVHHFHGWCVEQKGKYKVEVPRSADDYIEQLEKAVAAAVSSGTIPKSQYGAVLIDEGHDFKPEWLKLAVSMVDPETKSLLLLYDHAQSIYRRTKQLTFSLASVGIEGRGRTTILELNYRNTSEIIDLSYKFVQKYWGKQESKDDERPMIVPDKVGRKGSPPVLKTFESFDKELDYVGHLLKHLNQQRKIAWSALCVTYPTWEQGEAINKKLRGLDIPVEWLKSGKERRDFKFADNSVKLMTMHSSKGLEFHTVAVTGVGFLPTEKQDSDEAAAVLYVALTRATENLLITSHKETDFTAELQSAL
jgi:hypothetical protein